MLCETGQYRQHRPILRKPEAFKRSPSDSRRKLPGLQKQFPLWSRLANHKGRPTKRRQCRCRGSKMSRGFTASSAPAHQSHLPSQPSSHAKLHEHNNVPSRSFTGAGALMLSGSWMLSGSAVLPAEKQE